MNSGLTEFGVTNKRLGEQKRGLQTKEKVIQWGWGKVCIFDFRRKTKVKEYKRKILQFFHFGSYREELGYSCGGSLKIFHIVCGA